MSDRPAKFGAEDLRQLAWRNSYLKSKDEQEFHPNHSIPRVSKFGIKRDSVTNKTTLPPLVEECIPSVARHGVFNNEPMPSKNPWYKRRTSLPSSITCKHQVKLHASSTQCKKSCQIITFSIKEIPLNSITLAINILVYKVASVMLGSLVYWLISTGKKSGIQMLPISTAGNMIGGYLPQPPPPRRGSLPAVLTARNDHTNTITNTPGQLVFTITVTHKQLFVSPSLTARTEENHNIELQKKDSVLLSKRRKTFHP